MFCLAQDGFVKGNPSLAYWQAGNKKEVVIVLHGGPAAQHEYLQPEFDALEKVATVIYYDQRGCGKSSKASSYIWQEHVQDLRRVIRSLAKDRKVFLAGSSWGSTLAMIYAYKHPEDIKGLLLTGTYPWEGQAMTPYAYSIHRRSLDSTESVSYKVDVMEQRRIRTKKLGRLVEEFIPVSKQVEIFAGNAHAETRFSFATAPVMDSLKQVQVPVLIFNGTRHCEITDWGEQYVHILPRAELHTIVGACHDPWLSNPEEFFSQSKSFIKRVRRQ